MNDRGPNGQAAVFAENSDLPIKSRSSLWRRGLWLVVLLYLLGSVAGSAAAGSVVGPQVYVPITPTRILDTRLGVGLPGPLSVHVHQTFAVTGLAYVNIPASASAVTGNLTVTGQTSNGYLFIGPDPMDNPTSSTLNFPTGDDRANAVTVALGVGGTLSLTFVAPTLGPTTHAIFDISGYYLAADAAAGPQGPKGDTGAPGPQGPAGAKGNPGATGAPGTTGATGAPGPQGPAGATGDPGATGAQGPAGAAGAQGPQGPAGAAGAQGPQGPAGATGDPGATGAQGAAGAAGADGNTVLYGTGAPTVGTGVAGNFYIDTNSNTIYGPKTTTWPAGTSLVGPQGDPGAAGAQGPAGAAGTQGPQGPAGATGDPGATGAQGAAGAAGADGNTVLYGTGAPTVGIGVAGNFYIATDLNLIYGPKTTTWPAGTSLVGPQGDPGATGAQGPAGAVGAQGPQGPAGAKGDPGTIGAQGDTGATGAQGPQGASGSKGDTGATGQQGPAGAKGDTGATGPQGPAGPKGDTGATGAQGPAGAKGDAGATGATGATGQQGPSGVVGTGAFYGNIGYIAGSSNNWVFVGPTATVVTTASSGRITGSAVAILGATTAGVNGQYFNYGICVQPYGSGPTQIGVPGGNSLIGTVWPDQRPFPIASSVVISPPGQWNVGFCVLNDSSNPMNNNSIVSGWVQVTNN